MVRWRGATSEHTLGDDSELRRQPRRVFLAKDFVAQSLPILWLCASFAPCPWPKYRRELTPIIYYRLLSGLIFCLALYRTETGGSLTGGWRRIRRCNARIQAHHGPRLCESGPVPLTPRRRASQKWARPTVPPLAFVPDRASTSQAAGHRRRAPCRAEVLQTATVPIVSRRVVYCVCSVCGE